MIKKALAFIIAAVMIFSLAACSNDGSGASLKYPINEEPICVDPQIATGQAAKMVVVNSFEGLVRLNKEGKIVAGVAESWSYDSSTNTYTFKLRQDTHWKLIKEFTSLFGYEKFDDLKKHTDTRVKAQDFVFGFRRAVDPNTKAPDASSLYIIKNAKAINEGRMSVDKLGVKAVGDWEVKITLENNSMSEKHFLSLLTQSICMPCNEGFFNATNGRYGLDYTTTLCNGPFYFKYWTKQSSLTLKKNDEYTGSSEVMPAGVTFFVSEDIKDRMNKFVDGVYCAAPLGTQSIKESSKYTVKKNYDTVWSLSFNCADEYLQNTELRRALCSSINSANVVSKGSDLIKTPSIIPPACIVAGTDMSSVPVTVQSYDPAKAQIRWNNALDKLEKSKISLELLCLEEHESAMRRLIQEWQHTFGLSINVSITVLPYNEIQTRVRQGDYQIALTPVTAYSTSAAEFLSSLKTNGDNNIFNYTDTKFDRMVDELHLYHGDELLKKVREAERKFLLNGVALPIFSSPSFYAIANGVEGIFVDPESAAVSFLEVTVKD